MRLVVTRPEEDAGPLADRLRSLGHDVVAEPMLSIVTEQHAEPGPGPWRAILATSANGIRALAGRPETAALLTVPVLTVGEASADAARGVGFVSVTGAGGDLASLAGLVRSVIAPGDGRLLYVTGRTVSGDLAGMLGAEGYDVVRLVLYDAVAAESLSESTAQALVAGTIDGVLLFSKRTAQIWAETTMAGGLGSCLGRVTHYCLSSAIAEAITGTIDPPPPIAIARRPETEALLVLLER